MNIYRLSQTVNNDYDTYDSAVVVAESEEAARETKPPYPDYSWAQPADITVELIGIALPSYTEGTIICASFNAG
jgi:hypothetical protein